MRFIFAYVMLALSTIAMYHTTRLFRNKTYKKLSWCLYSMMAFASSIWSFGYGMMFLTNDMNGYAIFRVVGMVGIVLFMIAGQLILGVISGLIKKIRPLLIIESLMGVAVIVVLANKNTYSMTLTANGIVTAFNNGLISLLYTLYILFIAVVFVVLSVKLKSEKYSNRFRMIGEIFVRLEVLIGIGIFVDTVLPALGINFNIPASTILQYAGVEMCNRAVLEFNRNNLDIGNMSSYISRSVKMPIMVFDQEHKLRIANTEAKRFFNLTDEDLKTEKATNFWQIFFEKDKRTVYAEKGQTLIITLRDTLKNRYCRLSIDSVHDNYDDYIGYIVSVNDLTREMNQINDIRRAKEEAEAANKAKSQFLANMSHEIRTPMNAIIGFSEMALSNHMEMSNEVREYFEDINTAADGLLETINSILNISKIESGKMELIEESYSLKQLCDETTTVFSAMAAKKNLEFKMNISSSVPNGLIGDRGKVKEIIFNLLGNAIKYTEKGSIAITIGSMTIDDSHVELRIRVEDTGIGMKEEDLNGIFETFKRVDLSLNKKTEGTGLGLSIVKGYVELMGGQIKVKSTYGEGSVFSVKFVQTVDDTNSQDSNDVNAVNQAQTQLENIETSPKTSDNLHDENVNNEAKPKTATSKMSLDGMRILAVDDTAINLKVIKELLKKYGPVVDTANSGSEAIELAKNNAYDLILMDQMMPEMDGVEAMHRIRELGNGYEAGGSHKIFALTANEIDGVREQMLEEGFDDFLGKPIKIAKVEEAIAKAFV